MNAMYHRELDSLKRLHQTLCNDSIETRRKLYDNPDRMKRDILTEHLRMVRKLINDTTTIIRYTREYCKNMDRRDPKNMKPKKFLDPRVADCTFRKLDSRNNKSYCQQEIDGKFCLGMECPYITQSDEFETVSIATVQRTMEDVLSANDVPSEKVKKIAEETLVKLRNR